MKAAGFNPLLAAGAAASNSGPIQVKAPEMSSNIGADALAGASAANQIAATQAQRDLTAQQARKTSAEADYLEATNPGRQAGTNADMQVAVDTAAARTSEVQSSAVKQQWSAALQQVDTRVAAGMAGIGISQGEGGADWPVSQVVAALRDARVKAAGLGNDSLTTNIAAMAATVVRAKLDAGFLQKLGLPPALIEMIMTTAKALGPIAAAALVP